MKKFAAFILSLCATGLTLVACGQADNGQSSSSASESYQSNSSETESSLDEVSSLEESSFEESSSEEAISSSEDQSSFEESSEDCSSEEESSFEESSSEESSMEDSSSEEESVSADSSMEDSLPESSFEDSSMQESTPEDSSPASSEEESSSEESSSSTAESSNGDITLPEDFFGDNSSSTSSSASSSEDSSNEDEIGFTASEKELFESYFGFVIPFIDSDEYYVEEYEYTYEDTGDTELGVNYYAYGLTSAEYTAYKNMFANGGYEYDGQERDDYGDTWYFYNKDGYCIDFSYYEDYYGDYVLDVYVYLLISDGDNGGNGGNNGNGGNDSGVELLSNAGCGLPSDADGVYEVDFTKATYVKNVTEQGYYLDGCPTVGSPAVLVIPVEFKDVTAASKGYQISAIEKAFKGGAGSTTYYSVLEYYAKSSYGKLNLDITVVDSWFKPQNNSSDYESATMDYYGDEIFIGDQLVLDEALAWLADRMDLSKFDSDNNDIIDAVVLITTLDVDENSDFQWAYRYWNVYTDDDGYYYEYDGVSANDYLWASYQFMHERYDEDGNTYYDTKIVNPYTYIHEFGHILGADDYYDTAYVGEPLGGMDMMDSMLGDHNAYTKFNYGWLTNSRLVVASGSVTLTLESFSKNGDTILIANNWSDELGAYQEYYVVVYYKNEGLNAGEGGYFTRDGIVVYHVNATLYKEIYERETYYDVYNTNTDASNEYGTENNLIEFVKSPADTYTYVVGDRLSANVVDDNGAKIAYTFTVDALGEDYATITFTKNN